MGYLGTFRVAMLAPPWIPVPAPGYGGIEEVVRIVTRGLVARGHEVTLFAAPGSSSAADVVPLLDEAHPEQSSTRWWRPPTWLLPSTPLTRPAKAGNRLTWCMIIARR